MVDEIQLSLLVSDRQAEFDLLDVTDDTLTPTELMAATEMSASDFADIRDRGGCYVPIIVVPSTNPKYRFEVKDGRRRVDAYRKLYQATEDDRFRYIPAIIMTGASDDELTTLASVINSRRSPNLLSDLESVEEAIDRWNIDPDTPKGLKALYRLTGIPIGRLKGKVLPLLDMPVAFVQAARKTNGNGKRKVPFGALPEIASLNKEAQQALLDKLNKEGHITWENVKEAKAHQTALKHAAMQPLPGFDEIPDFDFSMEKIDPVVTVTDQSIEIADSGGTIIAWTSAQWEEDPTIVADIVGLVKFAYENGVIALRHRVDDAGSQDVEPEGELAGEAPAEVAKAG